MAGAGILYKIEYLRINRTCPASTCGIFHTLYEPKFQVALTHRNWTGGLLPVNASSYILGASIQPLAWLCVGCSGLVRVYQACAVFLMLLYHLFMYSESRLFDICLGRSFLFSRTVRVHCSPQFFYRELR